MQSWLPFSFNLSLSNLTPPLSIQRRFISFLLRRSLGHLLKQGQFDVSQIDAQIGSGFVDIKDLELDCNAINSLLGGQPFQLESGTIATVTARVPWPNPFSSTVGLSIIGLQLQLRVLESFDSSCGIRQSDDLANSVASVAETFIHDELTEKEEAQLRQSIHEGQGAFAAIPGSMSSFLSEENDTPLKRVDDPEGVSIFAGLFESLLARFDFDASDAKVSLIYDDVTLSLNIGQIRYSTSGGLDRGQDREDTVVGERRSIQVSEVRVTIQDGTNGASRLSSPTDAQAHNIPLTHEAHEEEDDSELDDETQTMMSRSLAFLPPHPARQELRESAITTSSPAPSMYKSAKSIIEASSTPTETSIVAEAPQRSSERTTLSISEPITLRLTTPPVAVRETNPDGQSPSCEMQQDLLSQRIKFEISLGIVAVSLDASSVYGLLRIVDALNSASHHRPSDDKVTRSDGFVPALLDRIDVSLQVKGVVVLVLGNSDDKTEDVHLHRFHDRPLLPPRFAGGYARLHVNSMKMSLEVDAPMEPPSASASFPQSPPLFPTSSQIRTVILSCTIADFSVLAYHSFQSPRHEGTNLFTPVLITDGNLHDSYRYSAKSRGVQANNHSHPYSEEEKSSALADIDVTEWYSELSRMQGTNFRPWRIKSAPATHRRKIFGSTGAGVGSIVGLPSPPTKVAKGLLTADTHLSRTRDAPAFSFRMRLGDKSHDTSAIIETIPLHVFLDLELLRSILDFFDVALPDSVGTVPTEPASPTSMGREDIDDHDYFSPDSVREERRRLEKLVLEDLNLDMDYLHPGATSTTPRRTKLSRTKPKRRRAEFKLDVRIPLVRVEVRAPPPQNQRPRSGSLVVDLHRIYFSKSASEAPRGVPTSNNENNTGFDEWFDDQSQNRSMSLEMQRVVIAYAALGQHIAKTAVSLGPIGDAESNGGAEGSSSYRLLPLVLFRNSESSSGSTKPTALFARIPSLHAVVDKAMSDGLQLWIDDASQWTERLSSGKASGTNTSVQVSRETSLIGSRYFIQRTASASTDSDTVGAMTPVAKKGELVVKLSLSEAFIRLVVPHTDETPTGDNRLIDVCASDLDTLVEVKPEGKDESVVTLNVHISSIKESSTDVSRAILVSRPLGIDKKSAGVFKLRFRSVSLAGTVAKESKIKTTLQGLTISMWPDPAWIKDVASFVKAPPGAFESVIPSERMHLSISMLECALRLSAPSRPSALILVLEDIGVSTSLIGEFQETVVDATLSDLSALLNDDTNLIDGPGLGRETDSKHWMSLGCALIATVQGLTLRLKHNAKALPPRTELTSRDMLLSLHLCADSISGIVDFVNDLQSLFPENADGTPFQTPMPWVPPQMSASKSTLLRSLDEQAFRRPPVIGPLPDMINDDLPRNPEYLDASFGAAAGLRALDDEDEDFSPENLADLDDLESIVSRRGGETIKMLHRPIEIVENYFDTLTPSSIDFASEHGEMSFRMRLQNCDIHLLLYDGYDWERTRHVIREEVKRVRRRLAKIRQLLASGQTYDPNVEATTSVLFNSVHVGLDEDADDLEGDALMAAIDNELADDTSDIASEGSWQSFQAERAENVKESKVVTSRSRLDRATKPSIELHLRGMAVDFDQYVPGEGLASCLLSTVKDLEILDHIRTSTWSTFLTELKTDSRGNIRETDSNMVRIELQILHPFDDHQEETRLKAKILPLRLHVDQDALDFLKKFFSFKDSEAAPSPPPEKEIFFQHVEIFPIDIKLDYKPRRVDYKALKEGRTIELMNFFHFDGSEMTLRHLTLKGITGWARMFDVLNDLWTPDVKANQLVDVISGVSPIRSAVNVGSGIADLVLLPIAQYRKDGRIIRGLQKGATAFMKSTAMEAIKLGTRLATGTQVVLEQTEHVLGAQFSGPVTAEALQSPGGGTTIPGRKEGDGSPSAEELYSRYAEQPVNVKEGMQSAYRSLSENIKYAGQTILAVPMEVYERSGSEGPTRAVIRAVPIAVLKPMIGASEAISKTLMGLHNTLDPQAQAETEAKYKHPQA